MRQFRPQTASTRMQFQFLSELRLREAKHLLKAHEWRGALYLAGYAAECILKAFIASRRGGRLPPEHLTHDISSLQDVVCKEINGVHLSVVRSLPQWSHLLRYSCEAVRADDAANFINAAKELRRCLSTYL